MCSLIGVVLVFLLLFCVCVRVCLFFKRNVGFLFSVIQLPATFNYLKIYVPLWFRVFFDWCSFAFCVLRFAFCVLRLFVCFLKEISFFSFRVIQLLTLITLAE